MRERNSQVSNYLTPIAIHVLLRTVLTPLILLLCLGLAIAQPANDDCNADTTLPTDGSCITGNNSLATADVGNGSCANPGAPNVWFSFTADGMDYDINVIGLGGSAEITLIQFQGIPCDFGSAVEIDCGPGNIVGNNVLTAGQQYYISITSSNGSEGPFSICVDNPADPPPPPNDDPCSPQAIPADGSCTTGTTLNGTQDWSNPNCPNLGETSVWYQVTLGPSSNSLDVTLGNQTLGGDVSAMVGTFNPDCTGGFLFTAQYCGPANGTFTASGLMPNTTYWIVVSSEEANAGMFDICVTESGPPPACAAIDECAGAQDISTGAGMTNCVTGCNTGTAPDNVGGAGCFDFSTIPTVWFTFTTDNNTDFVNININSPSFDLPQIAVFEGDCSGFALTDCINGAGGTADLTQIDVAQNTTYYIAVGSVGGQDGDFNLCLSTVPSGGTNCNVSTTYTVTNTSLGSPPSGPFQAGEDVTICMDVTYSSANNNCQWLHGLVPEFGACWDDISFNPDGSPVTATTPGGATWNWYADGDVVYNDVPGGIFGLGDPVGAGWFVTGVTPANTFPGCAPGDEFTDPNCSWGAPMGCGTQQNFQFCVTLTTKMYPECDAAPDNINCGITIRTFGDGETGGWNQTGCQLDVSWNYNASLNCCDPPDMLPLPAVACSGEQIDIFLDDFLLPPTMPGDVTYTWTVSAPGGVTGASGCQGGCGNILSQILTNSTSSPQIVTYMITPRTIDGCVGLPTDFQITVLPEIVPTIDNPNGAVCSGQCVLLFGSATGGAPPYFYEWSTDDTGISTEVCPTFTTSYFLTVTDANDCSAVEEIVVEANPNLNVTIVATPNITEICESDPQFPIQLTAFADIGGPGWIYNWELANGGTPSIPIVQATSDGLYCVTLTDANGCTGEDCLEITVHPEPTLILFPVDPVCQFSAPVPLTVVTIPAGGTGTWSGNINADGSFVPDIAGLNTVCYDFTDDNSCPAQECMDILVNPVPGTPTFTTFEPSVCSNQTGITYCVDPVASATSYTWSFPAGVTITTDPSLACVTVDWNGAPAGDVCVTANNDCGSSAPVCQAVSVEAAPAAPSDLSGPLTPCVNEIGLNYTISAVAGATSYTWTVTGGTITSGQGSTGITVDWGTGIGTVCVTADNACGSSAPACIDITPNSPPDAPISITDPGAVCAGDNGVIYSIAAVANATTYNWTVPAGATFTGNGTTSITVDWGTSTGGQICVNAENACGTSVNTCIMVTPDTAPLLAGPINGLDIVCANDAGVAYSIGSATGATGYTWTITGGTQASGGTTENITVDWGAGPAGQVCVTADNTCGSSAPICLNVTINSAPATPTPPANANICEGDNGDIYSIAAVAGATTYNWTVPAPATFTGQGTTSINIDWGASTGTVTVCVNAGNTCGDSPDACFDVTLEPAPVQPGVISGPIDPCSGSTGIAYSITAVPGATTYNWTVPSGATFTGNGTTSILVDWGLSAGGPICVTAENPCGVSAPQCLTVTPFGPPVLTGAVMGTDILCANTTGEGYVVADVPGATSYTWTITGGTQASGGSSSSITVDWGAGPTGRVCVTADNACGSSAPLCLDITIGQVPATPLQLPDETICAGAMNVVYSVPAVPGATSYNWTFPPLATISGQGTNTVSVNWNGATSGPVCVNAQNACGISADACFNVTIDDLPAAPTMINGNDLLCQDSAGEGYSISAVPGATSYVWTVGGSGSITSGQGTTSITVDWGNTGGNVCVYAVNDCGDGPEICLPVAIDLVLPPPSVSCGASTTNSVIFNWTHPTATSYTYTYTINGGPVQGPVTTSDNTVQIASLTANDIVEITIIAIGGSNVCGDSQATVHECEANDCPLTPPTFDNVLPEYCVNETGIVFTATPTGGTFSGPGVAADGTFDPAGLPAGPIIITYSYTDANNCPQSADINTMIVLPIEAPTIVCGAATSSEIAFSWSHPTATMFEYFYTINSGPPTSTVATSLTDLNLTGLNEGDLVELFVVAIGNPPCGNSVAGSQICEVATCADTPPLINGINDPYCEDDGSVIQFTGVPNTGSFSGAGIDADGTFHPDALPPGPNPITYSYIDNIGCVQTTTVDVQIAPILTPPDIACGASAQDFVTFNWFHPDPAVTEFIYTISINSGSPSAPVTTSDLSVVISSLNSADEVTISIVAVGINVCGNSAAATITCIAEACQTTLITIPIDPQYCITDTPVQLVASDGAGTYSGSAGVSSSGLFDPAAAGLGTATIDYEYIDAFGCPQSTSVMTEVVDIIPAPQVSCQGSTTDEVTFLVTSGATDFEYTYTINGGPVQGPMTTNNTTINIGGLSVNDEVVISVIAIGTAPCGNSAAGTATCQAQDCPVNPPSILNLDAEYCNTEMGIILMGSPAGGTFDVDGTDISGPFNPSDYSPGPHTIGYTIIDANGCPQTTSGVTTIVSPPQGPAVICETSTTNSVTFSWTPYPGASGYTYSYTVDGGPVQGPFNTVNTDITIPGLTVNQVVDITVVATGLSPCNESLESVAQCIAQNCTLVVDIDAAPNFCLDGSQTPFQLTVVVSGDNGTGTGTWSGSCLTGPNNDIFDANACGSAGIQNVTYTYIEDGCTQMDVIQINVFDAPLAEAGNPVALTCGDPDKELNGAGSSTGPGVQYMWTGPGVITNETTLTPTVNSIGIFTLTVTSPQGCIATDQVNVTQDGDLPVVTASPVDSLTCDVDQVDLIVATTPATDVSYLWTGPGITTANETQASPSVDMPGIYTVVVTNDLNGCPSLPVQIEVLENREIPVVIITNPIDTIDCFQSQLTFDLCLSPPGTDNTNFSYEWYFNGSLVSDQCVIMVETPAGIYTYVVTDTITGCRFDGQVEARDLVALPLADAGDDATLDCRVEQVRLQGPNTEVGPDIIYKWTGPGIIGPDDEIGVDVELPGTYIIEVTNTAIGCVNTSAAIVISERDEPLADAGPDRQLDCDFNPVVLDGTGTTGTGALVYTWIDPNGGSISQSATVDVTETGIYSLAVEDLLNGCVDTAFVEVRLNDEVPQNAILDLQNPSCFGENDGFINVVEIVGGTPPFNYSFNGEPFSSGTFLNNLGPGQYNLMVVDAAGCEWETAFNIDEPVEVGIDLGPDIEIQLGTDGIIQGQVSLNSEEIESIDWSPLELVECIQDDCRDVILRDLNQTTTIRATVIDTNQCEATDEILVRVKKDRLVYIPNVFSPNEDGQNDIFYIFGGDGVERVDVFRIYDRWGEVVFSATNFDPNDEDFGWDGKLRGVDMNPAVFVYHATVTFVDGFVIEYTGDVTLVR